MVLQQISASQQLGFPLLSVLIFLPILAAGLVFAVRDSRLAFRITAGSVLVQLALSVLALVVFVPSVSHIQLSETMNWMPSLGIQYRLGLDGLSVLFLPLTAVVFLSLVFATKAPTAHPRVFYALLLLLQSATFGMYSSLDLMLFFCFFEFALLPSYWLIRVWGVGPDRHRAASKYVVYMLLGSLPLLVGFILLGMNQPGSAVSFDWVQLVATPVSSELQGLVFLLMILGFAVKGPALPVHTWMPTVVMEGPVSMGAYLLGLKVGAYGLMRFVVPLAPEASREWSWLLMGLGILALLYGGLIAITQSNFRRLIAFSSLSHVGLIVAAIFAVNASSWQGAMLLMINAGLATSGLLLVAGFLYRRFGTTEIAALGGLARRVPKLAFFCFVSGLALIGLPGTSGFVGELLAMSGVYQVHWAYGALAVLGVVLSAGYFLWFYQRAFFGPLKHPGASSVRDLDRGEFSVACLLMVLMLAIGVAPKSVLLASSGSVHAFVGAPTDSKTKASVPVDRSTGSSNAVASVSARSGGYLGGVKP